MNIVGKKVRHKAFGEGTIIAQDEKKVTVSFNGCERKFGYPGAFAKFVEVLDDDAQQYINALAEEKAEADEQEKARKTQETEEKIEIRRNQKTNLDGIDADYHIEYMDKKQMLDYKQVEEKHGVQRSGWGKGINKKGNEVFLFSSLEKRGINYVYHDHWDKNGDFIYSGEGKIGEQKMIGGNKALVEASDNNLPIHLYIKVSAQEYYYQGIHSLVEYYLEDEKGEDGVIRKEYKFRLRKSN